MKDFNWIKKNYIFIIPFTIISLIYFGFMIYIIHKVSETDSLSSLGSFGDSFGILNALFSGLGFSGLLITLFYQQRQINSQENESKKQDAISSQLQYEETLHKLISLFHSTMKEVKINYEGGELFGRDALQKSLSIFTGKVKSSGLNVIPARLSKKYRKNELTDDDKEIINYYYYKHFIFLSSVLSRQWRLIESFKILLRHLEENCPENSNIQQYRDLVFSQLTYVECTYIFLVALGGRDNAELRKHMISSSMYNSCSPIKLSEIHKMMFKEFWGMDLSRAESNQTFPINKSTIKHIKIKESDILQKLNNLNSKTTKDQKKITSKSDNPDNTALE
ncbi:hypothetical protein [Serratia marcescens]|uniref:hypothetical protein n=1 Tax=Serratia marcescens TaxID=615 RepID=UPI0007455081|nr:hypothetical protein [Serratia marcescens]CVE52083.1 Uncharacterised protein [Serratia marcescens]